MPEESDKCRIHVNFHFREMCLRNLLDDWPGKVLFLSWKRGDHKGSSRRQVASGAEMLFLEQFSVPATITHRKRSNEPKYMSFALQLVNSPATSNNTNTNTNTSTSSDINNSGVTVAKGVVDLSSFAITTAAGATGAAGGGMIHKTSLPLTLRGPLAKHKSTAKLFLEITVGCEVIKLNKKRGGDGLSNRTTFQNVGSPPSSSSVASSLSLMMPSSASLSEVDDCFSMSLNKLGTMAEEESSQVAADEEHSQPSTATATATATHIQPSEKDKKKKSNESVPFFPRVTKSLSFFMTGGGGGGGAPNNVEQQKEEKVTGEAGKGFIRKSMTIIDTKKEGDVFHLQKELLQTKKQNDDLKEKVQKKKRKLKALKMELELLKKERRSKWLNRAKDEEERAALSLSQQGVEQLMMERSRKDGQGEKNSMLNLLKTIQRAYKSQCHDYKQMIYWLSFASNLIKTIERERVDGSQVRGERQTSSNLESCGIVLSSKVKEEIDNKTEEFERSGSLDSFLSRLYISLVEIFKLLLAAFYVQVEKQFMSEVFHFDEEAAGSTYYRKEGDNHVQLMSEAYEYMKQCNVLPIITSQFFDNVFLYLNAKTFNALLRDEQLVTEKTGISLKTSLSLLEEWAINTDKALLLPPLRKQMRHVKEAAILLVMPKMMLVEESSFTSLFSSLNLAQIRHLLSSFSSLDRSKNRIAPTPSDMEVVEMLKCKLDQMCSKHSFPLTLPTASLFDVTST